MRSSMGCLGRPSQLASCSPSRASAGAGRGFCARRVCRLRCAAVVGVAGLMGQMAARSPWPTGPRSRPAERAVTAAGSCSAARSTARPSWPDPRNPAAAASVSHNAARHECQKLFLGTVFAVEYVHGPSGRGGKCARPAGYRRGACVAGDFDRPSSPTCRSPLLGVGPPHPSAGQGVRPDTTVLEGDHRGVERPVRITPTPRCRVLGSGAAGRVPRRALRRTDASRCGEC